MKRFALLFLICVSLFSACKKSGGGDVTPVDPRDRMVGTYAVNGNIQFEVNGALFDPLVTSGTITVSKPNSTTAAANQLILNVDFPDLKDQLTVELTGSQYALVSRNTETFTIFNNTFTAPLTFSGGFTNNNELTLASKAEAVGNFTAIKRRVGVGTKK